MFVPENCRSMKQGTTTTRLNRRRGRWRWKWRWSVGRSKKNGVGEKTSINVNRGGYGLRSQVSGLKFMSYSTHTHTRPPTHVHRLFNTHFLLFFFFYFLTLLFFMMRSWPVPAFLFVSFVSVFFFFIYLLFIHRYSYPTHASHTTDQKHILFFPIAQSIGYISPKRERKARKPSISTVKEK